MTQEIDFWLQPETVARLREKPPDRDLEAILDDTEDLSSLPSLDLGCAGGRNAAAVAARGAPVFALDSSVAMCATTRDRIGRRVIQGRMDDLPFPDRAFALVVAIGVYQQGETTAEIRRAIDETARVLRPGGLVLVSVFAEAMLGSGARSVPGEPLLFDTSDRGRVARFSRSALDAAFRTVGFLARGPIEERRRETDSAARVTLLAVFRRE